MKAFLIILGKVSESIVMEHAAPPADNRLWLFVDTGLEVELEPGQRYPYFINDEVEYMGYVGTLEILVIKNQFGDRLPRIPAGWRTICLVEFTFLGALGLFVPPPIEELPSLETWTHNPKAVKIEIAL